MHVVEIGFRPTHERRFQRRAHFGDAGENGFGLLQPRHRFGEQLFRDGVATLRERGGVANQLQPFGGERGERTFDQILTQAVAVFQSVATGIRGFDGGIQQRGFRWNRQLFPRLFEFFGMRNPQQATHALRVVTLRFGAIGMHRQRHAVGIVVQCGIRGNAAGASDGNGNRLRGKIGETALRKTFGGPHRKCVGRAFAETRAQVVEVPRFGQHDAIVDIHQPQIGAQMRIDAGGIEVDRGHVGAGEFLQKPRQRAFDTVGLGLAVRRHVRFGEGAGEIRRRHEIAAQRFRQRFDQPCRFVGHKPRRQPRQSRRVQRVEQMQRHRHGHTIVDRAGLETILDRQPHIAQRQIRRKALRIAGAAHHQIVERPFKLRFLGRRQFAVPRIQRLLIVDLRRQTVQIPLRLPVFVHNQSGATLLGFLFFRFRQHRQIARQKRGTRVDLARHQRVAHEDLPRFFRKQCAVVHRLFRGQHQPEQADLFAADHAALRARPVRVVMSARKQMR